jgi:hypothetical protein
MDVTFNQATLKQLEELLAIVDDLRGHDVDIILNWIRSGSIEFTYFSENGGWRFPSRRDSNEWARP